MKFPGSSTGGVVQGQYNFRQSIVDFVRASFNYALDEDLQKALA